MKVNKAAGPDKITGKLIKTCRLQLCSVFHVLFQLCFELGEIPLQRKTAEIVPIPKKPNPVHLNDYRPIALTSLLMKLFERIVLKYMLNIYLTRSNLPTERNVVLKTQPCQC